jgi:hypothetical protein
MRTELVLMEADPPAEPGAAIAAACAAVAVE